MSTATMKWTFDLNSQNWAAQPVGISALSFESSLGNPAGCLSFTEQKKNQNGGGDWILSGTWESIFGIPTGSIVTNILAPGDGFDSKCDTFEHGALSNSGPLSLEFLSELVPSRSYDGVDSNWVRQVPTQFNQTVPSVVQASNSSIAFTLTASVSTGDRITAVNRLLVDNITITITYV